MQFYQVGGAVRDRMLGLPVKDNDWVVVGATPDEMVAAGFLQIGKDFPVFLHPDTKEEYALARTERKTGHGYGGFDFDTSIRVSLEEDLRRRDLTINAMAIDGEGRIIDPTGGQKDLARKVLRHISPAFVEDPVRLLRVARLAAHLKFTVAPETMELMQRMVTDGEVDYLVPERVWAETQRALSESRPRVFFEVLRECGALARLMPELERLWGVPQSKDSHPEVDTGEHTMRVLDAAVALGASPLVRFAALCHDLGKGTTPREHWPHHPDHEERGVELVQAVCARLRVPNDYRKLAALAVRHHGRCHRALEYSAQGLLELLSDTDAFRRPERFEQFLLACEADFHGRPGFEDRPYVQGDLLRAARDAAVRVDTRALLERGIKGKTIAEEVKRQRVPAIEEVRKQFL